MEENQFRALCQLLDEEHGETYSRLCGEFKSLVRRQPAWEDWIADRGRFSAGHRVHSVLEDMRWEQVEGGLRALAEKEGPRSLDLEKALHLLCLFADPETRTDDIARPLDRMASDLTELIQDVQDPDAVIRVFRHYLFKSQGFKGNNLNYYDPENSYLHKVLDRKTGIPISLSAVCLLVAQRVSWQQRILPLYGIGLPTHFIVQFRFADRQAYLDPFHGGKPLSRKSCMEVLELQDIPFQPSYLDPVHPGAIVSRTISNLIHIYDDLGEERKRDCLLRFLQALSADGGQD